MAKKISIYGSIFLITAAQSICLSSDKDSNDHPISPRVHKIQPSQEHRVTTKQQAIPISPRGTVFSHEQEKTIVTALQHLASSPKALKVVGVIQPTQTSSITEKSEKRRAVSFKVSPIPQTLSDNSDLNQEFQARQEQKLETQKDPFQ